MSEEKKETLKFSPSQRGVFYENFKYEVKDKFRKLGAFQKTILVEALNYHFRNLELDVKVTKNFPKKGEKVEEKYVVKIKLLIPGLEASVDIEKTF